MNCSDNILVTLDSNSIYMCETYYTPSEQICVTVDWLEFTIEI